MEVKKVLCMKTGGENGYEQNAFVSVKVATKTLKTIEKAIESAYTESFSKFPYVHQVFNVADLGCAFGPLPLEFMSTVIRSIVRKSNESKFDNRVPEIQFYLNDLVANDFNTLFKGLSIVQEKHKDVTWFALGAPGSFHGRLFPRDSVHLVHSSYAVHWLSKGPQIIDEVGAPLNKGKIYISKTSPSAVPKAYLSQFQQDFSSLLKFRSQELAPNGRMVLIFNGRQSKDPVDKDAYYFWEVLAEASSYLVSQGLIDEEKLHSLNVPYYNPSLNEIQHLIDEEDSLTTEFMDTIALEIGGQSFWPSPELRMKNFRSFSEPIVSNQFGEEVMDKLYNKATQILADDMKQGKDATKHIAIVTVLKKKEII